MPQYKDGYLNSQNPSSLKSFQSKIKQSVILEPAIGLLNAINRIESAMKASIGVCQSDQLAPSK